MDKLSPKQIAEFNRPLEPSPFNTGPPIPPPSMWGSVDVDVNVESETAVIPPDLSSSPTSTAPSSPHSNRSVLSLDDPEIRKIWEDSRFGPVIRCETPDMNSWISSASPLNLEEYSLLGTPYPVLKEEVGHGPLASPALNPLAQPFMPVYSIPIISTPVFMVPSLLFAVGDRPRLSPLDFQGATLQGFITPVNEQAGHAHLLPPPYNHVQESQIAADLSRPLDPLFPPGLPHPPQNVGRTRPGNAIPESAASRAYTLILVSALQPEHNSTTRQAILATIFGYNDRWDLFSLRELAVKLVNAAFGEERDLLLTCAQKACLHGENSTLSASETTGELREDVFFQVVESLMKLMGARSGQAFVDTFSTELINSIVGKFILYFDPNNPDSLNLYEKTHNDPPCMSYIGSAFSLCKNIANLYRHSLVHCVDVDRSIDLLLQEFKSVEHLQALEIIVVGCGRQLWDPPLWDLSTPSPVEGVSATSSPQFAYPRIKDQAKAKLHGNVNKFCSKLDSYKIKRGQSGCESLRGKSWNWNGVTYKTKMKEFTDTVRQWEEELVNLIDQREEPSMTKDS